MNPKNFVIILFVIFLNLLGTIFLVFETFRKEGSILIIEILLILVLILFVVYSLVSFLLNSRLPSMPLLFFFTLSLVNLPILYFITMDSLWMIIILCIANFLGLFILGTMVLIPKKKNILLKPFTSYDVVHNIEKIEPIEKFEPIKKFEHIEKRREINSVAQDEIGAYESIPESSIIEGSEEMSFKDSISIKPKRKSTKKTVKRKVKKK